jgi:glycosyltransferase involved in cell wall biosynthesis
MKRFHLYFINFNDSYYLPFLAKHYAFCERITMFDNYSTDNSVELAKSLGFEVKYFGKQGELNDQHYLDVKNNCWKESRGHADYVIVCDADEFLFGDYNNVTCSLPMSDGYNMISNSLPKQNITEINTGTFDVNYGKQIMFCPNRIYEINYVHGCHVNKAVGDITSHNTMKMLHYRMIGGVYRIINRHRVYLQRMSQFNHKHNMGHHYKHSEAAKREEWNTLMAAAKIVI